MKKAKLTDLINALNKGEIRNLKAHISRTAEEDAEGLKTVQLFDAIKKGTYSEFDEELVELLYENGNKNAFYRLKNRLIHDIEQSILLLSRNIDIRLQIYRTIELANIFKFKTEYDTAFDYLKKAEKMAQKAEHTDLLDLIYEEILHLTEDYYKIPPDIYIKKKHDNLEAHKIAKKVRYLLASIKHQLRNTNYSAKNKDVIEDLNNIIEQLSIEEDILNTPSVKWQIHESVRTVLLQSRNFEELEKYLIESFHDFEKDKMFSPTYYEKIFPLLSWIISVLTINKKFNESLKYVHRLEEALLGMNRKYYYKYVWIYHQGLLGNYSFVDKNQKANEMMKDIIANPKYTGNNFHDIFIHINHSLSYYNMGNLDQAIISLRPLLIADTIKNLSRDLQLRINFLELLVQTDSQEYVYAEHKINEMRRTFRKELPTEQYNREKTFLAILREIVCKPAPFKNEKILQKIETFIQQSPNFEPGSNEFINYKIWLQSKLQKRSYYSLILEVVGTNL